MQHGVVARVAEGAEQPPLVVARILEQSERLVGVRRDDDLVEAVPLAVVGRQLDAAGSRRSERAPTPSRSWGPSRSESART